MKPRATFPGINVRTADVSDIESFFSVASEFVRDLVQTHARQSDAALRRRPKIETPRACRARTSSVTYEWRQLGTGDMTANQAKLNALDWIRGEHPADYSLRVKPWTDESGDSLARVAVNAKNGRAVHQYVIALDTGAVWRMTWDETRRGTQVREGEEP